MLEFGRIAVAAAALALAPVLATAEPLNLLVMGEDAEPGTVERHTPVFDRVVEAISGELRARGFHVYDETAVTIDYYDQGRVRRSDAELISLARSVQIVPIDAVATFEIHAATVPSPYEGITDLRLRIAGRAIAVTDGLTLGGYEVSYAPGELPPLPLNCRRACQIAFVGDQAQSVARDVGSALAGQLDRLMQGGDEHAAPAPDPGCDETVNAFTLALKGFSPHELARIETFLTAFQGYADHRIHTTDAAAHELRYETCADADRLESNLRAMFDQTGAEVWLEADAQGFSATRIAAPAAQ